MFIVRIYVEQSQKRRFQFLKLKSRHVLKCVEILPHSRGKNRKHQALVDDLNIQRVVQNLYMRIYSQPKFIMTEGWALGIQNKRNIPLHGDNRMVFRSDIVEYIGTDICKIFERWGRGVGGFFVLFVVSKR
jgi:hypothetical protein